MRIRKNAKALSPSEKAAFVNALLALKKSGTYDRFVSWHHHSMMLFTSNPYEPQYENYRNAAHRGPAFLPWHREFLRRLEEALQAVDSTVTLPYWDWAADSGTDWTKSPVWTADFMGGNGDPSNDNIVTDGPFSAKAGNWRITFDPDGFGPALKRNFGDKSNFPDGTPSLPSTHDLELLMKENVYDFPPYNPTPFGIGFRNRLEGWVTKRGDVRVSDNSSQLHNRVHLWVSGNMTSDASPNDPVFFLNHCNVDRIWAQWQAKQLQKAMGSMMPATHDDFYLPNGGGPPGHNLLDQMYPWSIRPLDLLDHHYLGYQYDDEPYDQSNISTLFTLPATPRRATRFDAIAP